MHNPGFDMLMRGALDFPRRDTSGISMNRVDRGGSVRWAYTAELFFRSLTSDFNNADDTAMRRERSIERGFPYLKTRA